MIKGYKYKIRIRFDFGLDLKYIELFNKENLKYKSYSETRVGQPWETFQVYCFNTKHDMLNY